MDKDFLRQIDDLGTLIPPKEEEVLSDDFLICECFCVSAGDIRTACESQGKVDLELIQNQLSLGQGCQGCIKRIDSWIEKIF
jgi:NAD(P)H-nitrite reductase large subunit